MEKRKLQISVPIRFLALCGAVMNEDLTDTEASISEMNMVKRTMIQYADVGLKKSAENVSIPAGAYSGHTKIVHFTFHENQFSDWLFSFPPRERRFQFFQSFLQGFYGSKKASPDAPESRSVASTQPHAASTGKPLRDPFTDLALGLSGKAHPPSEGTNDVF